MPRPASAQVYERAIGNVPLPLDAPEKRYWQRYIYLWLNYALWEELEAEDPARCREVYRNCLKLIPHRIFTFAKVCTQSVQAGCGESRRLRACGFRLQRPAPASRLRRLNHTDSRHSQENAARKAGSLQRAYWSLHLAHCVLTDVRLCAPFAAGVGDGSAL